MTPSTPAPTDAGALADEPSELLTNIRTAPEIEQERLARKAARRATHARVADTDCEMAFIEACDEAGCAYDNEALLKAIADLKRNSAPQETRGDEPVAWRWRQFDHGPWSYADEKPDGPSIHLFRVEAVYAAPQQSPRLEREGIARIIDPELYARWDRKRLTDKKADKWFELTHPHELAAARAKADAILALLSPDTSSESSPEREPGPMVPWELDCRRSVCAAPVCECQAVSSTTCGPSPDWKQDQAETSCLPPAVRRRPIDGKECDCVVACTVSSKDRGAV